LTATALALELFDADVGNGGQFVEGQALHVFLPSGRKGSLPSTMVAGVVSMVVVMMAASAVASG
jgi:hypothetical protein